MQVTTILRGGLGNNLFQIANLLSYSIKHNIPYCIPKQIDNPHYEGQPVFYSKYLNYCDKYYMGTQFAYSEKSFEFNEIPRQTCMYYVLSGYFQSQLYFNDYREKILTLLDILYTFKKYQCAILIRRGDYLNLPAYHPTVSGIYLQEAQMKMMKEGIGKFEVYSDDIEWCKNYMPQFDDADYYFSEGKTDIEDLSLASSCAHQIGSNSAYSFWAYYLNRNENKIGIFPKKDRWFGKALPHIVDDLYMKEWCLI